MDGIRLMSLELLGSGSSGGGSGGGVTAQAGRPLVDAGQNQRTWFQYSNNNINAGTFKLRFVGTGLDVTTAAIDPATDRASSQAGFITEINLVLGAKDTNWAWCSVPGRDSGTWEENIWGMEFLGTHANKPITVTIVENSLNHGGSPGEDTIIVTDFFSGRPVNAAADTGAAGTQILDTYAQRLYVAGAADTWAQVSSTTLPDTNPIRVGTTDPPDDTNFENSWGTGLVRANYQRKNGLVFVSGSASCANYLGGDLAVGNQIFTLPAGFKPAVDWHVDCRVSGCATITSICVGFDAPEPGNTGGGVFPVLPAYMPGNPTYQELIADNAGDSDGGPTIWFALQGVPIHGGA